VAGFYQLFDYRTGSAARFIVAGCRQQVALFRQTFLLTLAYPSMEVSLQKLLGQLQDSGNVTTIKHYLDLFEGAVLIKVLQKYSGSELKKRGSSPKIVPLNTALINARRDSFPQEQETEWMGRLFECAVGAEALPPL
jgi:predicted AAA+ superfamily ATPase